MNDELANEIFQIAIEVQRLENRKYEIQRMLKSSENAFTPNWETVQTAAMKFKMEAKHVNA